MVSRYLTPPHKYITASTRSQHSISKYFTFTKIIIQSQASTHVWMDFLKPSFIHIIPLCMKEINELWLENLSLKN